jgi:hypothetical protein
MFWVSPLSTMFQKNMKLKTIQGHNPQFYIFKSYELNGTTKLTDWKYLMDT